MSATLAVVVPTFNEGLAINDLLVHLLGVSDINRIIFVDASDDTESQRVFSELATAHQNNKNLHLVKSEQAGRAAQMNLGAGLSQEDVLLFLHCDTRLPPTAVSLIHNELKGSHHWGRFDVCLDANQPMIRIVQFMINLRSRCRHLATGDQGIFIRRKLFTQIRGYRHIPLMEDIDLSRRLSSYPPALIKQPVVTSARRWQKRGVIRTILLMWWLRFAFWLGVSPHRLTAWYGHAR